MTVTIWDAQSAEGLHDRLRSAAPAAGAVLDVPAAWDAIGTAFMNWVAGRDLTAIPGLRVFASDLLGASKGRGKRVPGLMDRVENTRDEAYFLTYDASTVTTGFAMSEDRRVRLAALNLLQRLHDAAVALDAAAEALATIDELSTGLSGGQGSMNAKAAPGFLSVAQTTARVWCEAGQAFPASNRRDGGLQDLIIALHVEGAGKPPANPEKLMGQLRKWRNSCFINFPS